MKTKSKTIAMMMLVLFMASCKDKDARMLTIINEDGTCTREYSFHAIEQALMIPQEEDFDSLTCGAASGAASAAACSATASTFFSSSMFFSSIRTLSQLHERLPLKL